MKIIFDYLPKSFSKTIRLDGILFLQVAKHIAFGSKTLESHAWHNMRKNKE